MAQQQQQWYDKLRHIDNHESRSSSSSSKPDYMIIMMTMTARERV